MARNKNQQPVQASSYAAQSVQSNKPMSHEMRGKLYELGLFMYVLTQKQAKSKNFDIGKEVKIADKFDDLAIRLNENGRKEYVFVQAKLVDNPEQNLIDNDVLLGKKAISLHKDDFNLRKYFVSYLRIKDQLNSRNDKSILKQLIIFTNAGSASSFQNIAKHVQPTQNIDAIIPKTNELAKYYKLEQTSKNLEKKFKYLKEHLTKDLKPDLKSLSEELAKYITTMNQEPMVLDKDYFNYYHTALIDEKIIEIQELKQGNKLIKQGQFTQEFIEDNNALSDRAKRLRNSIVEEITKTIDPEKLKQALKKATLPLSDDFGVTKTQHTKIYLPNYSITDKSINDFFGLLEFRVNELGVKGLFKKITYTQIKEAFLSYYDIDPRLIEFIVRDFVEKWKNSEGSTSEGWVLNSQREQFVQDLGSNISKPKAKHKTWEYIKDLEKIIKRFDLQFCYDCYFTTESFPVDKKAFSIKTDSTLLSSIKMIEYLKKMNQEDYIFINIERLIKKEEIKELVKTFRDDEFKLLILCYDSSLDGKIQQELFDNLSEMMKNNQKRIVLITSAIDDALIGKFKNVYESQGKYKEIQDKSIALEHIKDPSQILKEAITFQDQSLALNDLIIKNKNSLKLIDAKTIDKIITDKGKEIKIGSKPLGTSYLEGAYAELFEEINKETLIDHLPKTSKAIYIISGIYKADQQSAKNRLLRTLKIDQSQKKDKGQKKDKDNIESKTDILTYPYSIESTKETIETIQLVDAGFEETNFKQLCDDHSDKKVYWIKWDEPKLKLQNIYNPDFYTSRKFKKAVIKKDIKKLLIQETADKFIFSGIDNYDALAELLRLRVNSLNNDRIFIIQSSEMAKEKFDGLDGTVHWLQVENNGGNQQIIWRDSKGSLGNIRTYIDEDESKKSLEGQDNLLASIKDKKAVIIADDPGMGKSTTLVKLYSSDNQSKLVESHWVINVNLRQHLQIIKEINTHDVNIPEFLSQVSENLNDSPAQSLLNLALNPKKNFKSLY